MNTAIVWFRHDLRLADNPALSAAINDCEAIIPVFIDEDSGNSGLLLTQSQASHVWLHHSLQALAQQLAAKGSRLIIRQGDPLNCLQRLCKETKASHIYWNRRYDPVSIVQDTQIKKILKADCSVRSFQASLAYEPWQNLKKDGTAYRVFTAFWKASLKLNIQWQPLAAPISIPTPDVSLSSLTLEQLGYLPDKAWHKRMMAHWQVGEQVAEEKLQHFLTQASADYKTARDFPAQSATSRLSPHLHFGEISPQQIFYQADCYLAQYPQALKGIEHFKREVVWREFAYHLLYHFPITLNKPLDQRFRQFPWREKEVFADDLKRWQQGQTGFPIIDAGLRELWQTGSMHNRVRMIVASLLTKNLLIPWQEGERWFRDTLVDADIANNVLGWQWVAGCGADAAPYFRIFNPVLQSQKFDPKGEYIRRWVPELKMRGNKQIHLPRELGDGIKNYPLPIVDLKASRVRALECFAGIKG